jgi:phage gp46-like protein
MTKLSGECGTPLAGRRRVFWTSQYCGERESACGDECANVGLAYVCPDGGECRTRTPGRARTIRTTDWVRGLVLNILLTDGRRADTSCGWRPGTRGGHWSDGYRVKPGHSGSSIRYLSAHGRASDAIAELLAIVKRDMARLIDYGVATAVDVKAEYVKNNRAKLEITVYGRDGETALVGVMGQRASNSWVINA